MIDSQTCRTDDDIKKCLSIFTEKMSPSFISNLVWFNRPPIYTFKDYFFVRYPSSTVGMIYDIFKEIQVVLKSHPLAPTRLNPTVQCTLYMHDVPYTVQG